MPAADDVALMRLALEQAALAEAHADVPVGALVTGPDGAILGTGHNRREVDADPTAPSSGPGTTAAR